MKKSKEFLRQNKNILPIVTALGGAGVALFQQYYFRDKLKQAKEESRIDELTGLQSKRAFKEQLEKVIESQKNGTEERKLQAFSMVLFVDLNKFKKVNDKLGHSVGDEVLVNSAEMIQRSIRHGDEAFRIGGDEFAVILNYSRDEIPEKVHEIVDGRLNHQLSSVGADYGIDGFGAAVGFAVVEKGDTYDSVRERADAHMYEQKNPSAQ